MKRSVRTADTPFEVEAQALACENLRTREWTRRRTAEGQEATQNDRRGRDGSHTEADQLRQQLLQAQKLSSVGALASSVAHEFNNILTTIINYARLALRPADEAARTQALEKNPQGQPAGGHHHQQHARLRPQHLHAARDDRPRRPGRGDRWS